jgi:peptidoglycan/LPS O-acetylase OafA/YrhL
VVAVQPAPAAETGAVAGPTFSARRSLPYLDGIRAFAVLMIFFRHAWGLSMQPDINLPLLGHTVHLTPYVDMMQNGVDLFFVLSGYLLARKWFVTDYTGKPRPSLRRYARTRFFRIAPPFWIALAIILAAGLLITPHLIPHAGVFSAKGGASVLAHVGFLQAIFYPAYGSFQIATPFWTLTVEVVFYFVLPVLVLAFLRNRWLIALPACLLVTLGWLAYVRWSGGWLVSLESHAGGHWMGADDTALRYFLAKQFPAHLFDFAAGMAVANLDVRRDLGMKDRLTTVLTSRTAGWISLIGGTLFLLAVMRKLGTLSLQHQFYFGTPELSPDTASSRLFYFCEEWPSGLAYALIIHGASCLRGRVQGALSFRPLAYVGVIGYSVYLFHMPFIWLVNRHLYSFGAVSRSASHHLIQNLLIAGLFTFSFSALYYRLVEKPFQLIGLRSPRKKP